MKKRFLALTAAVAVACGLAAPAHAATAPTTGVELNDGIRVTSTLDLDQKTSRDAALKAVREARAHYYDDNIVFEGISLQNAVMSAGLTRDDYVNISWDPALERIAIQRTAEELYSGSIDHRRPDGSEIWSATYKGTQSWGENLCQNSSATECVASLIKPEEDALKAANGYSAEGNGHLHGILNPRFRAIGFSYIHKFGAMQLGDTHSGETAAAPTGTQTVSVAVPESDIEEFRTQLGTSTLRVGRTTTYGMSHNGYTIPGTITVDDPSIASVTGNRIQALSEGTTTVRYTSEDGKYTGSAKLTVDNSAPTGSSSSQLSGGAIGGIIVAILALITAAASTLV